MTRVRLILGCLLVLAAAVPTVSTAAPRMPVGFQDDPSFRWREDRVTNFDNAVATDATIIRSTAYWSRVAPTRPANATDPLDPGYHFEDIDELVRSANLRGMTVLLTIFGTPGWANGNRGDNHAPTNMQDLQNFSQALAARYSGRLTSLGPLYVRYYSLWNEPNLAQFLAPAYTGNKPSSPAVYARMAKAFIAGVRAGNPRAQVGIGETSPRGRPRPIGSSSTQETIAPGLFAQLVAKAQPNLKFDAWAHHPYSGLGQGPTARVAFPNVNLPQIPTFEKKLQQWFKRKFVKIWITEYGFETKPDEPKGVTTTQQAAYTKQTMKTITASPYIYMFIWFIFRDDPTSTWQSGLENEDNSRKPAFGTFTAGARGLDYRSPIVYIKPKSSNPVVRLPVWELFARDGVGAELGATVRTYAGRRNIAVSQPTAPIGVDGYASFVVPLKKAPEHSTFTATFQINDKNGNRVYRTASIVVVP
jgi:Cellulase (glycosyl hydrolase family 5)